MKKVKLSSKTQSNENSINHIKIPRPKESVALTKSKVFTVLFRRIAFAAVYIPSTESTVKAITAKSAIKETKILVFIYPPI